MAFDLHPQLAADTAHIADWPLCRVLLMRDANFPWLILVPRRDGLRDFHDVAAVDEGDFLREVNLAAQALKSVTDADKMNVAALGNMVPQLHVHVIARFEYDLAWPGPVWGKVEARAYEPDAEAQFIQAFLKAVDEEDNR